MNKINVTQKLMSLLLIICLVFIGNIKNVIGDNKKEVLSNLSTNCQYQVIAQKVVYSSTKGKLTTSDWYNLEVINGYEGQYSEDDEIDDCVDVVQPGKSLGDKDVTITTCYYYRYILLCPEYASWKRTIYVEIKTNHVIVDSGWEKITDYKTCGIVSTGTNVGTSSPSKAKTKGIIKYLYLADEKKGTNPTIKPEQMPSGINVSK